MEKSSLLPQVSTIRHRQGAKYDIARAASFRHCPVSDFETKIVQANEDL
jgi:hypothetical protein